MRTHRCRRVGLVLHLMFHARRSDEPVYMTTCRWSMSVLSFNMGIVNWQLSLNIHIVRVTLSHSVRIPISDIYIYIYCFIGSLSTDRTSEGQLARPQTLCAGQKPLVGGQEQSWCAGTEAVQ